MEHLDEILVLMKSSGSYDRLKDLVRKRLNESGWSDEVYLMAKEVRKKPLSRMDAAMEVSKMARSRVPNAVKQELLQKVKESLLRHNGYYDDV